MTQESFPPPSARLKEELIEDFRVQTIQEAAMRVIARRGLPAATMQEIAEEAGVAKGTLYLYFKNREDLLDRTAEFAFSQLLGRLESVFTAAQPLADSVRALVGTQIEFFDSNREFFQLYLEMKAADAGRVCRQRAVKPLHARYLERLSAFLGEAMARGEVRRGDPSRLAMLIIEPVGAIVLRRISESAPPPAQEEVDWIVDALLHGLQA